MRPSHSASQPASRSVKSVSQSVLSQYGAKAVAKWTLACHNMTSGLGVDPPSETRSSARSIGLPRWAPQLCRKRVSLYFAPEASGTLGVQRGAVEARPCDRSFKYALTTSPSRCTRGRRLEALTSLLSACVCLCVCVCAWLSESACACLYFLFFLLPPSSAG